MFRGFSDRCFPKTVKGVTAFFLFWLQVLGSHPSWTYAPASPLVIHIEEAHAQPEAQRQIARMIRDLSYRLKTKGPFLIALEGGSGPVDLEPLRQFAGETTKRRVMDFFLDEALVGGAAYEAVLSSRKFLFAGIEDPDIYEKARALYLGQLQGMSRLSELLDNEKQKLRRERMRLFSPKLNEFYDLEENFLDGRISLAEFWKYLKDFSVDLGRFGWLRQLDEIQKQEAGLDQIKLKKEWSALEKVHPRVAENLKSSRYDLDSADLIDYPTLRQWRVLSRKIEQLPVRELIRELDEMKKEMRLSLISNQIENKLVEKIEQFRTFETIIRLEATRRDWESLSRQTHSSRIKNKFLKNYFDNALSFYRMAEMRDRVMVREFYRRLRESNAKVAFLVTGGFHTEGIQRELERLKLHFVTVSPRFVPSLDSEKLYHQRISGDLKADASALASRDIVFTHQPEMVRMFDLCSGRILENQGMGRIWNRVIGRQGSAGSLGKRDEPSKSDGIRERVKRDQARLLSELLQVDYDAEEEQSETVRYKKLLKDALKMARFLFTSIQENDLRDTFKLIMIHLLETSYATQEPISLEDLYADMNFKPADYKLQQVLARLEEGQLIRWRSSNQFSSIWNELQYRVEVFLNQAKGSRNDMALKHWQEFRDDLRQQIGQMADYFRSGQDGQDSAEADSLGSKIPSRKVIAHVADRVEQWDEKVVFVMKEETLAGLSASEKNELNWILAQKNRKLVLLHSRIGFNPVTAYNLKGNISGWYGNPQVFMEALSKRYRNLIYLAGTPEENAVWFGKLLVVKQRFGAPTFALELLFQNKEDIFDLWDMTRVPYQIRLTQELSVFLESLVREKASQVSA